MSAALVNGAPLHSYHTPSRVHIDNLTGTAAQEGTPNFLEANIALVWPYSSRSRQLSWLLVEDDVLLREKKGQVKVTFHAGAAAEVGKARLGVGDHIKLALSHASSVQDDGQVDTPGKKTGYDLHFHSSVQIEARSALSLRRIEYTAPPRYDSAFPLPGPLATPTGFTGAPVKQSTATVVTPSRSILDYNKSALEDQFSIDDGTVPGKGRKRTKFARESGAWRLLDDVESMDSPADPIAVETPSIVPTSILDTTQNNRGHSVDVLTKNCSSDVLTTPDPKLVTADNIENADSSFMASDVRDVEEIERHQSPTSDVTQIASIITEAANHLSPETTDAAPHFPTTPSDQIHAAIFVQHQNLQEHQVTDLEPITTSLPTVEPLFVQTLDDEDMYGSPAWRRDPVPTVEKTEENANQTVTGQEAPAAPENVPNLLDTLVSAIEQSAYAHDYFTADTSIPQTIQTSEQPADSLLIGESLEVSTQMDPAELQDFPASQMGLNGSPTHDRLMSFHGVPNIGNHGTSPEQTTVLWNNMFTPEATQISITAVSEHPPPLDSNSILPMTPQATQPVLESLEYAKLQFSPVRELGEALQSPVTPVARRPRTSDQMFHDYFSPRTSLEAADISDLASLLEPIDDEIIQDVHGPNTAAAHPRTDFNSSVEDVLEESAALKSPIIPTESTIPELVATADEEISKQRQTLVGLTTSYSYYTPLADLVNCFNTLVDVLAICTATNSSQRAMTGPKDFFTTLHVTDHSLRPAKKTVSAQFFRPYKFALPTLQVGDVILLRNMKVQSKDRNSILISTDVSGWVVFGRGVDQKENVSGPPVEYGDEERHHAAQLNDWWVAGKPSQHQQQDTPAPQPSNHEVKSPAGKSVAHVSSHDANLSVIADRRPSMISLLSSNERQGDYANHEAIIVQRVDHEGAIIAADAHDNSARVSGAVMSEHLSTNEAGTFSDIETVEPLDASHDSLNVGESEGYGSTDISASSIHEHTLEEAITLPSADYMSSSEEDSIGSSKPYPPNMMNDVLVNETDGHRTPEMEGSRENPVLLQTAIVSTTRGDLEPTADGSLSNSHSDEETDKIILDADNRSEVFSQEPSGVLEPSVSTAVNTLSGAESLYPAIQIVEVHSQSVTEAMHIDPSDTNGPHSEGEERLRAADGVSLLGSAEPIDLIAVDEVVANQPVESVKHIETQSTSAQDKIGILTAQSSPPPPSESARSSRRYKRLSTSLIHELRDGKAYVDVEEYELVSAGSEDSASVFEEDADAIVGITLMLSSPHQAMQSRNITTESSVSNPTDAALTLSNTEEPARHISTDFDVNFPDSDNDSGSDSSAGAQLRFEASRIESSPIRQASPEMIVRSLRSSPLAEVTEAVAPSVDKDSRQTVQVAELVEVVKTPRKRRVIEASDRVMRSRAKREDSA